MRNLVAIAVKSKTPPLPQARPPFCAAGAGHRRLVHRLSSPAFGRDGRQPSCHLHRQDVLRQERLYFARQNHQHRCRQADNQEARQKPRVNRRKEAKDVCRAISA